MTQELYSVEQIANLLGLHVRTVRSYVRDGRLKAVKIGKQYRVSRADVEALTGRPAAALEPEPVSRTRQVEVSSIVEVDAISPASASRLSTVLLASGDRRDSGFPARVETVYQAERGRLKIILLGSMDAIVSTFKLIQFVLDSEM